MATKTQALDVARRELGHAQYEFPAGSNRTKYGKWYGLDGNPWCAMFVSWVLAMVNNTNGYRHASVAFSLDWARKNGRHKWTAQSGDIACRIHNGSWWGAGHNGIVEAVHSDGSVTCIEGNTSPGWGGSQSDGGGTYRRRRPGSYWNRGYIRIDYDNAPAPPPVTEPPATGVCADPAGHPLIRRGSTGRAVNHGQYLLQRTGARIAGDGDFGLATEDATKNHQRWAGLEVDGVIGPNTWSSLHRHTDGLRVS